MDIEYVKQNAESTGNCGDGLTWWQLGGELYIEGQGEVTYRAFEGRESIQNVVIAPGCTGIGARAFKGCNLKSVSLPDGLQQIGARAFDMFFSQHDNALSVIIPDSVTYIGMNAFCCVDEIIYKGSVRPEVEKKPPFFSEASIVAYNGGVCVFEQIPVLKEEMDITVSDPFCCDIGDAFWTGYYWYDWEGKLEHQYRYVQAQLLAILEKNKPKRKVRIRILQIKDRMSLVEEVPREVKNQLNKHVGYHFDEPIWVLPVIWINNDPNLIVYDYTAGDLSYSYHIFTDADGIDHLIQVDAGDDQIDYNIAVGDKVLGYHSACPYQWENGLLINWNEKRIFDWHGEAAEMVIPEGIEGFGPCYFSDYSKVKRITIPDSFERWGMSFHFFDNLKEIILTGNSKIKDEDIPQGVSVIRLP